MLRNKRRLVSAILGLGALTVPFVAVAAPAEAISVGGGGPVIVCTVSFNNPHGSNHVNGTVNFTISTACNYEVPVIRSFSRLTDLTHNRIQPAGGATSYNSKYNNSNSALSCDPAYYQGDGVVEFTFPPGYVPQLANVEGASRTLYVVCGAAQIAPTGSGQAAVANAGPTSFTVTATATAP